MCRRSGWPTSRKYWRAIFSAASIASDPPETKTRSRVDPGIAAVLAINLSASRSIGSVVKKPVWAKGSVSTWCWIARITAGWLWPRQDTAAPPEASR
jgi:hypothetical protein